MMSAALGRTGTFGCSPIRRSNAYKTPVASNSVVRAAGPRSRLPSVTVNARAGGAGGYRSSTPDIAERIVAAVPYLIPFFDAIQYGRYLFYLYPALRTVIQPVLPVLSLYHSIPFGSFIVFFGVYMLIVNNKSFSRFTRFNAMQALLMDVSLTLPRLVEMVFTPPTAGWGAKLYLQSQSFIWIFTSALVVFGIVNALLGIWGRIPFLADAADSQLMR